MRLEIADAQEANRPNSPSMGRFASALFVNCANFPFRSAVVEVVNPMTKTNLTNNPTFRNMFVIFRPHANKGSGLWRIRATIEVALTAPQRTDLSSDGSEGSSELIQHQTGASGE
jgi:hypothetical protein